MDPAVQIRLRHQTVANIPLLGGGQVQCLVERFTKDKRDHLDYERRILSNLPEEEFIGLARYYYVRNCQPDILLRLTNLAQTNTLRGYVISNLQTLSMQNRLNILYQISVDLKYLRDHSIVYHNLTPETVRISRSIETKLYDMSNCYLNDAADITRNVNQFKRLYRNKLPYVVNCLDEVQEFETYN